MAKQQRPDECTVIQQHAHHNRQEGRALLVALRPVEACTFTRHATKRGELVATIRPVTQVSELVCTLNRHTRTAGSSSSGALSSAATRSRNNGVMTMHWWAFSLLVLLGTTAVAAADLGTLLDDVERNELRRWFHAHVDKVNRSYFAELTPFQLVFMHGGQLQHFFERPRYALIGASDGVSDQFLVNFVGIQSAWRAIMVEPVESNVKALFDYVDSKGMRNRSTVIHAACTGVCAQTTVTLHIPKFEELFPDLPHWLRRQLATMSQPNMTYLNQVLGGYQQYRRPPGKERTYSDLFATHNVPCVETLSLLRRWPSSNEAKRAHFLSVDAEGQDVNIVSGLLASTTPRYLLPLLLLLEIKSLSVEEVRRLEKLLVARGYLFSALFKGGEVEGDVFAILQGRQRFMR